MVAEEGYTMSVTTQLEAIALDELRAAASYCFPPKVQERFMLLQTKNNEGTLTESEAKELQALVKEYNARTLEKAKALLELQRRSVDNGESPGS